MGDLSLCVCWCTCMYVWKAEHSLTCHSSGGAPCFLTQGLSLVWNTQIMPGCLGSHYWEAACYCRPRAGITSVHAHIWLYCLSCQGHINCALCKICFCVIQMLISVRQRVEYRMELLHMLATSYSVNTPISPSDWLI